MLNCIICYFMYVQNVCIKWNVNKLELWVTSLSDTPRLQYYDVLTLEYRYVSKLPMKNERIWSYVKETTSHLQNKLTKKIHLGVTTSTGPPVRESISWIISPSKFWTATIFLHAHLQVVYYKCVKFHKNPLSDLGGVTLTMYTTPLFVKV